MDLITNIIVSTLTFVAGLLTNVLANDICRSADRVCTGIVSRASRRLAPFDQRSIELEWLGDLSERETVYEKYHHAIGCYLVAGRMRRTAQYVTLAMNFRIDGVGTVPLNLNVGPPSLVSSTLFAMVNEKRPRWISRTTTISFAVYALAKFLVGAYRLGPGNLHRSIQQLTNFKKWGLEMRLRRKGIDLDLSKIFTIAMQDPTRIPMICTKLGEIFKKPE